MAENTKEKKKKLHNSIILAIIFLVCIGFIIYLCVLYNVYKEEQLKVPVIHGMLSEIYPEDLEHYVLDNSTSVIYMCVANDETCRIFERDLKKLVRKKDYHEELIYLNLTDTNVDDFVTMFNEKYPYKKALQTSFPAFVLFEDGEVENIVQGSEEKPLTISKVKNFLEFNKIGE